MFQIAFGEMLRSEFGFKIYFVPKSKKIGELKYFKHLIKSDFFILPFRFIFLFKIFSKISIFKTVVQKDQFDTFFPCGEFSNVIISGYFQHAKSLIKVDNYWNKFFSIDDLFVCEFRNNYLKYFENRNVLTIHVRLGDYLSVNFKSVSSTAFVGWDWYRKALSKINLNDFDTIFLISDEPDKAKEGINLQANNLILSDGKEITDLQLLMNSDVAVISNSSFAWWGAFLNNKPNKLIYAPYNWIGHKKGVEFPTGIMIDEFIWVE
jgi:hypothetical protein